MRFGAGRRKFGEDVWYSFSFKISGDIPQSVKTSLLPPDIAGAPIRLINQYTYLSDMERYACNSNIQITPGEDDQLPDPKDGWVYMRYHIRSNVNALAWWKSGPTAKKS